MDTKLQQGTAARVTPLSGVRGLPRNKGRGEVEEGVAASSPADGQKRSVGRWIT